MAWGFKSLAEAMLTAPPMLLPKKPNFLPRVYFERTASTAAAMSSIRPERDVTSRNVPPLPPHPLWSNLKKAIPIALHFSARAICLGEFPVASSP